MKLRLIALMIFIGFIANGQTNQEKKIIPPSPNASTLGRFGDIPVELYNGSVDISIPIYTVKDGDIEIPLVFNYHPSGVKVQQEATWCGLGWNFSPGGSVTRSVVGGVDGAFLLSGEKDFYKDNFLKAKRAMSAQDVVAAEDMMMYPGMYDGMRIHWAQALYRGSLAAHNTIFNDFKLYYERPTSEIISASQFKFEEANLITSSAVLGQGEPDIFYVNCPGLSFQFFMDIVTDKPVIMNGKELIKIEGSPLTSNNWVITNEKGFKYYFDIQETYNSFQPIVTSWLLSKIVSPLGYTVNFNYQNFGDEYPVSNYLGNLDVHIPDSEFSTDYDGTHAKIFSHQASAHADASNISKNYYLTSIVTSLETIQFNLQTRLDIAGVGARSLKGIDIIRTNGQKLRSFNCNYEYFNYSTIGSTYHEGQFQYNYPIITHTPTQIEDYYSKRLKLTNIQQFGFEGVISKNEGNYTFSYIEDFPLPLKTSCAVDHWGYYNGQDNTGLLPAIAFLPENIGINASEHATFSPDPDVAKMTSTQVNNRNIPAELKYFNGANRASDESFMQQGMLKTIVYPTGGKTSFIWEANRFSNFRIPSVSQAGAIANALTAVPIETSNVQDYPSAPTSLKRSNFSLTKPLTVKVSGELLKARNPNYPQTEFSDMEFSEIKIYKKDGSGNLTMIKEYYFNSSNSQIREQTIAGVKQRTFSTEVPLQIGDYVLECSFIAYDRPAMTGGPQLYGHINYKTKTENEVISEVLNAQDFVGGGLRIKEILKIDNDGKNLSRKVISYFNEDGKTSGLLMSPLNYISSKWLYTTEQGRMWSLNSSSYVPLSSSAKGNLVGYNRVIEEDYDVNGTNGKIIAEYNNDPSRYYANLPTVPAMTNGLLKSSKIYSSSRLISESNFEYKKLYSQYYRNYKATCIVPLNDLRTQTTERFWWVYGSYFMSYYPLLSELNVLSKKEEISYPANSLDKITFTTGYDYSPFHFKLIKTTTTDNKGMEVQKTYSYPNEMVVSGRDPSGIYQGMVTKNIVHRLIESSTTKNGKTILSRTNYIQPHAGVFVPGSVEVRNTVSGVDEKRLVYNNYDPKGNPLSLRQEKGLNICYIWSYNSQYPIAEIKNADYSAVVAALGGATAVTNFANSFPANKAAIDTFLAPIRNSTTTFKDTQITSYSYDPLVGIRSMTDAKGMTTTYEYDDFQRLKNVKDHDGNIIKNNDYHYKP